MSLFRISTSGDPRPWLTRLGADMDSPRGSRLVKSMGTAAEKTVRTHFRKLDEQRHRGFSTRNFYGGAAGATSHEIDDRGIVVVVGDGQFPGAAIALRFHGGTVRPRAGKKWLTIPVADEAQGRRIGEFGDDVQWIVNRRTRKGVATLGGRVLYALTDEATHDPDKSVLPTGDDLAQAMQKAAESTVKRIERGR